MPLILLMSSMDKRTIFPNSLIVLIIFVLQVQVVLAGTLLVSLVMSANGYDSAGMDAGKFNQQVMFIRNYGMVLMIFPALWIGGAVYYARPAASLDFRNAFLIIGLGMLLLGMVYYLACAWSCTLDSHAHFFPGVEPTKL